MAGSISNIDLEIVEFLNEKVVQYNNPKFIESDPISIPHQFILKEDIEIAGFLTATIAWGNRKIIINNANNLMERLGQSPYDFVMTYNESQSKHLEGFVHRTFNSTDLAYFINALQNIYSNHGGLEQVFAMHATKDTMQLAIHEFKKVFFSLDHPARTTKHVSDPIKGSAAKRINMYLRWMVRNDNVGVDLGLWNSIHPSALSCPLDAHSGRVARKLNLVNRKMDDAKALKELDTNLRIMDKLDPVKYDFALFGLGVFENF